MTAKLLGLSGLALKIFLILFAVFLFFFTYNKFLIDHSLKSLEFSLSNIEEGALVGVDDILEQITIEAIADNNIRDSVKLDYAKSSLARKGRLDDTEQLLSSTIDSKRKKRGALLNTLDKVAFKADDLKNFVLSLGRKKSPEYLSNAFEQAKDHFDKKNFVNAQRLFREINRYGYNTSYGRLAALYLKNIEIFQQRQKKINQLLETSINITEPEELQKLYFEIGNLYMKNLEYDKSNIYFNKALKAMPKTEIAQRANFSLGVTKKMQGKLAEAEEILDNFTKEFPQSKLVLQTKLQLADIFRKQAKHDEAARFYHSLAKEFKDSPIADVILYEASCIYRFDLGKIEEANQLLLDLLKDYPASDLAKDAKKLFSETGLLWEEKKMGLKDRITLGIVRATPPLNKLMTLGEQGAVWYALYMIEGSIKQCLLQQKKKGDILIIKRTDEFLTRWVMHRIEQFLESFKQFNVDLQEFVIEFPKDGWVEVRVTISIGKTTWKSYGLGKMYLKKVSQPYKLWREEKSPLYWVVFDIQEAKIGPVKIPKVITDAMLKKAEATFNKKQIFRQEELKITPYIGIWAGEVKYDRQTLRRKLQEIESYKRAIRD